ncbi:balbiani ring protein 3-like, partial [Agrilus planipennis]|uniref:Balbiani ring protein 3-like n=1 Tax=Agrilus planipennis TaxID=224129 RepID=A0A7F5R3E5_AGRPL
ICNGSLVSRRGQLVPTLRWNAEGLEPIVRKEACDKDKFQNEYKSLKKKIRCQPRETVVELTLNNANVNGSGTELNGLSSSRIIPNVVVVKRCGGLCGGRKTCLSSEQKYKTFYVKTIKDNRVHCLGVQVAEDVKCRCGCDRRESQCTLYQTYDKNNCTCTCKNKTEKLNCLKYGGSNKHWDDKTCSCSCRKSQPCTTGTVWSTEECRCTKEEMLNRIW